MGDKDGRFGQCKLFPILINKEDISPVEKPCMI